MISVRKAKHLDAKTMFTYYHANTPPGQSERAYYLSYFIIDYTRKWHCKYSQTLEKNNKQEKKNLNYNFGF